jgi:hypothetical protein
VPPPQESHLRGLIADRIVAVPGFIQIEGELVKTLYLPGSLVQVP